MLKFGNTIFLVFILTIPTVVAVFSQEPSESALPYYLCWERELDKITENQIASDNVSKIFLLSSNGNIKTLDINSGDQFWNTDTGITNISNLSFDSDNLYIVGTDMKSLRIETGLVNISNKNTIVNNTIIKKLGDTSENKTITLNTNLGNINADEKGNIYLTNPASNKSIWKYKAGGKITSINSYENKLIAASLDNFVYMISQTNGEIMWKKRLVGRIKEEPIIFKNYLFISVIGENTAFVLDLTRGEIISRIALKSDLNFVKPLFASKKLVLFETSLGLASFSQNNCS